jgi:DNA-binding NtrC family response regulator
VAGIAAQFTATNRDPAQAIEAGKLRTDLYYRLNVFNITIPPLRERTEDIPVLAKHLAEQYAERTDSIVVTIDPSAMSRMVAHQWPGNVRELKNAIQRAALLCEGTTITAEHLPPEVARVDPVTHGSGANGPDGTSGVDDPTRVTLHIGATMRETEREMIRATLGHTAGNKTRAAKILDISLKTMHNKVKKYGL